MSNLLVQVHEKDRTVLAWLATLKAATTCWNVYIVRAKGWYIAYKLKLPRKYDLNCAGFCSFRYLYSAAQYASDLRALTMDVQAAHLTVCLITRTSASCGIFA